MTLSDVHTSNFLRFSLDCRVGMCPSYVVGWTKSFVEFFHDLWGSHGIWKLYHPQKLSRLSQSIGSYSIQLFYIVSLPISLPSPQLQPLYRLWWPSPFCQKSMPCFLKSPLICSCWWFCHFLPTAAAAAAKSLQSCSTLCDPIDVSPPGSAVPGILQARIMEWVAISFSSAWKWKVKVKLLSRVQLFANPWTAALQAPPSMGFSRQEYRSGVPFPSPICNENT